MGSIQPVAASSALAPPVPPPPTRLDALYVSVRAWADGAVARPALRAAMLAASLAASVLVATIVLDRFPNSGDEYAYVYQAQTLALGRVWNPSPPTPSLFESFYIVSDGDRTFSSFPVGWPLLLTGALVTGVPLWLVNSLLGSLSLIVLYGLGRELHGARIGLIAATVTGLSGFFLFNAASYFSHTFTGLLVLLAAYAAARSRDERAVWPLLVGFCLGWAVLARYFTGVVCGIPVVALLLTRRSDGWARALALVALGGAPWVLVLAGYNLALSGSPWRLTTLDETYGNWFEPRWLLRGWDMLGSHLLRYVLWTPPLLVLLYFVCLRRPHRVLGTPLDWMPLLVAASLFPYINRGGNQYGPRFYYEAFPFLVLVVAAALFREDRLADAAARRRFAALVVSLAVTPVALVAHAVVEHRVVVERQDPTRAVEAARLDHALVVISGRVGSARSIDARDLTRNGLATDAPVLFGFGTDLEDDEVCRLNEAHYDRAVYRYRWDPSRRGGVLTAIACAPVAGSQAGGPHG